MAELTIDLDSSVYDQLEKRGENKGFDTPEEYAAFVLTVVLDEVSEPETEEIEERLQDLGYLS